MGFVKDMVGNHEDHMRDMDCNMVYFTLKLVELQSLKEGFKHFVTEHWLPLIQYIRSFLDAQCSCGTDARDCQAEMTFYHVDTKSQAGMTKYRN